MPDRSVLAAMTAERLEAGLVGAAGVEAAAKARFLVFLGEFVVREGWRSWECVGPVQWLSWQCGLGGVAASEHVRVAVALRELPGLTGALASGWITWSKVRAITRVATPGTEATWIALARAGTAAHVERIVRAHRRVSADEVDDQVEGRSLSWRQADDGSVIFQLRVPAAQGAALVAAVEEGTTPEAGVAIAARRADTLVGLVLGPEPVSPSVMILTTAEALGGGPGPCITDKGIAVDAETAAMAACNGAVLTPDGPDSDPDPAPSGPAADGPAPDGPAPDASVAIGPAPSGGGPDGRGGPGYRLRRYPTTRTRRYLAARDQSCRFPGCHLLGRLDAHHLVHWIHDGPRSVDNLVLVCPGHHRLIHRHHLDLRFEPEGTVSAWRADGSRIDVPVTPEAQTIPTAAGDPRPDWRGETLDLDYILTCLLANPLGIPPGGDPTRPTRSISQTPTFPRETERRPTAVSREAERRPGPFPAGN